MKIAFIMLILCFTLNRSFAQKVTNEFFPLHNIIRGDSTYNTFDKQVALVKSAGYDGIEINLAENFEGMKAALDKHDFKGSYFYVRVKLDTPYLDNRLQEYISQLKGSNTIIAPFIISNNSFPPGTHGADTLVTRLLKQLSDWAKHANLQVAIYPHAKFYVERTDHAMALIKSANRKNIGLSFNLCHWLATTTLAERSQLQPHLTELRPYLKMITICGANDVVTTKPVLWDDYILPLGNGSFDTYSLVKYCVKNLKLKVPIGLQCYNIKADKFELVQNSIKIWREYKERIERKE